MPKGKRKDTKRGLSPDVTEFSRAPKFHLFIARARAYFNSHIEPFTRTPARWKHMREEVVSTLSTISDSTMKTMLELANSQQGQLETTSPAIARWPNPTMRGLEALRVALEGQMGFRSRAIQQRSSEVWTLLAAVKPELEQIRGRCSEQSRRSCAKQRTPLRRIREGTYAGESCRTEADKRRRTSKPLKPNNVRARGHRRRQ